MKLKNIRNIIYLILISLNFVSCESQKNIHGILISESDIENIIIDETNIDYFKDKYGEPSFTGAFNNNVYYKYETTELLPAGKKQFTLRKILALELDSKGIIRDKNILGLDDAKNIDPATGKTQTAGSEFNFITQMFSNFRSGRFVTSD